MTLTEVSFYTRRFLPIGVIMGLVVLIFYFTFQLLILYSETQKALKERNKPIVFNTSFGNLKQLEFKNAKSSSEFTYVLDTLDATTTIPEATAAAQIFFLPQSPSRFGFLQKIYFMAQAAGFNTETVKHELQDKQAKFSDGARTLTIDITNYNFSFNYTLTKEDPILQNGQVPSDPRIIETRAIEFLRSMDRYPSELAQGKINIVYLRYNPETNELATVPNPEDANMAEVDFYRPDINGLPVAAPSYFNSPHYVVLAFNDVSSQVIRAQVALHEKSTDQIGIYPLKSSETAWKELQSGKGYIVAVPNGQPPKEVKIKKILLAYLDQEEYQDYLQPIYIFLGEQNLVGYVPALGDNYVAK